MHKTKAVIISYKASNQLISLLKSMDIDIIFSQKANTDERIADHPDLQIHPVGTKLFVASRETYIYYKEKLKPYNVNVLMGDGEVGAKYPDDCRYNLARVGDVFVSKKGVVDPVLLKRLEMLGHRPIYQNQAYAKCMTICFNDFAITCDKSIYKALKDNGVESYFVGPRGIKLEGYNIGFLGGSCGIIDHKKIIFTGDIYQLEDYKKVLEIMSEKEIEIVYPEGDLVDLGSIIPID